MSSVNSAGPSSSAPLDAAASNVEAGPKEKLVNTLPLPSLPDSLEGGKQGSLVNEPRGTEDLQSLISASVEEENNEPVDPQNQISAKVEKENQTKKSSIAVRIFKSKGFKRFLSLAFMIGAFVGMAALLSLGGPAGALVGAIALIVLGGTFAADLKDGNAPFTTFFTFLVLALKSINK